MLDDMPPKQQTLNVVDVVQLQATIIELQQQIQRLQAGDDPATRTVSINQIRDQRS